jgi:chorismate mutase
MKTGVFVLLGAMALSSVGAYAADKEGATDPLNTLVSASAKRIALAHEVALSKWDTRTPVEDIDRENQVIDTVAKDAGEHGLDEKYVAAFFRSQIEANKTVQYSLLANWYRAGKAPDHAPVNLKETIRPQLDTLTHLLLDGLEKTTAIRQSDHCHVAVANAVGAYLNGEGRHLSPLDSIALDRSLSSYCISH